MIPKTFIQQWAKYVPWQEPRQIEQDLIITNSLLKIYNHPDLKTQLAFRGGTALNKLFFDPPSRYSEDIDLVQTVTEPIGATLNCLREVLDPWLGTPKREFSEGRVTLTYRALSDDGFPLKIKIEINTREHFSVLGFFDFAFTSNSNWANGTAIIRTFQLEELLGTKMRALYQRRKGRDLYDLYLALTTIKDIEPEKIVLCFKEYMKYENNFVSKEMFMGNIIKKLQNKEFRGDTLFLLPSSHNCSFDPDLAYQYVQKELLEKL